MLKSVETAVALLVFGTEIALRNQNRCMAQEKLNLLKFSTVGVAQLGSSAMKIGRIVAQLSLLSTFRWQLASPRAAVDKTPLTRNGNWHTISSVTVPQEYYIWG
jgi:hypothetical protein